MADIVKKEPNGVYPWTSNQKIAQQVEREHLKQSLLFEQANTVDVFTYLETRKQVYDVVTSREFKAQHKEQILGHSNNIKLLRD